jgi:hypothetical protein
MDVLCIGLLHGCSYTRYYKHAAHADRHMGGHLQRKRDCRTSSFRVLDTIEELATKNYRRD